MASVSVTEIVLNGFSIKSSPIVTCLGVKIDADLTFSTHVKQVAARCFYQLRQLWSIRPALTSDNAIMLIHALIASRVDYCNSVLFYRCRTPPPSTVGDECRGAPGCEEEEVRQHYADSATA